MYRKMLHCAENKRGPNYLCRATFMGVRFYMYNTVSITAKPKENRASTRAALPSLMCLPRVLDGLFREDSVNLGGLAICGL